LARALDLKEKTLGPNHPDVAQSLNNLAELYRRQGAYAKAEPFYARALDIRRKSLGPNHPDVATGLNNLAGLYWAQGAYTKAEPLYARSLDILEKAFGPGHPDVAQSLNNLAVLYQAQGAYSKAELLLARAANIQERQLRNELGRLSDTRKRDLMATLQGETYGLVSFHADAAPSGSPALELAFTTVLRRKGRILESLVDGQTGLRAHLTPRLQQQFDQLSQARSELAARLYAPAGLPNATAAQRDAVTAIRVRIDDLEAALGAASEEFRTQTMPVTVAMVQEALPAGAALVEFIRYQRFDPRHAQQPWQEAHYVAYLLTQRGPPRWVALGEAAPIDAAVDAVLVSMDSRIPLATAKAALRRLDALVFAPIRAQLSGISHVIIAPDGRLNLVSFEALIDAEGHHALERYLVSYVTSGRDLLRLSLQQRPRAPAVIFAGPDYGPPPSRPAGTTLSFVPLVGATAEAIDLRGYFPTAPVTGAKATKAALAALTGPAMLHIATHGFYGRPVAVAAAATRSVTPVEIRGGLVGSTLLPPPTSTATRRRLRSGLVGITSMPPPPAVDPDDGLDLSGLAMADANRGPGGLVTARELAGFDWRGTQLVVLSACQTGVGMVPSGDGVYGLRRALVLAGTASQVVSLWKVTDSGTRALMRDFYGGLKRGMERAEALRQAQLRLLHEPSTEHPFYWAAFILAGDWRPLDPRVFSPQKAAP
jgi:CHAT domain-containing protein